MRLRRAALRRAGSQLALPNPLPGLRTGVLSTSELATLWQLPRAPRQARARSRAPPSGARSRRRRSTATRQRVLLRDERGPVSIAPADRKYGHALIGGQGGGKSSVMARHFANDARDPDRAVILIDPKGPARRAVPRPRARRADRALPRPRATPRSASTRSTINATPGRPRRRLPAGADRGQPARRDPGRVGLLPAPGRRRRLRRRARSRRSGTSTAMLDFGDSHVPRKRRRAPRQDRRAPTSRAHYWHREFPALVADRGYAAQALNPPRNKLERLISTREIDTLLRHPVTLDLEGILERGEILIVAGAKAAVGEDNTILVTQLLLQLLHRAIQARQDLPDAERRRVSLLIDEAHNVLTPSVAKMLAEGRSAGLEAVFAWQYSAQIRDEVIRSGVRSLLQSISIFRMREMEDARSLAGLAMEVYSDRISDRPGRTGTTALLTRRHPQAPRSTGPSTSGSPTASRAPASSRHTLPMEQLHDDERRGAPPRRPARTRRATTPSSSPTRSPHDDRQPRHADERAQAGADARAPRREPTAARGEPRR